jgi:hypothetical protein
MKMAKISPNTIPARIKPMPPSSRRRRALSGVKDWKSVPDRVRIEELEMPIISLTQQHLVLLIVKIFAVFQRFSLLAHVCFFIFVFGFLRVSAPPR